MCVCLMYSFGLNINDGSELTKHAPFRATPAHCQFSFLYKRWSVTPGSNRSVPRASDSDFKLNSRWRLTVCYHRVRILNETSPQTCVGFSRIRYDTINFEEMRSPSLSFCFIPGRLQWQLKVLLPCGYNVISCHTNNDRRWKQLSSDFCLAFKRSPLRVWTIRLWCVQHTQSFFLIRFMFSFRKTCCMVVWTHRLRSARCQCSPKYESTTNSREMIGLPTQRSVISRLSQTGSHPVSQSADITLSSISNQNDSHFYLPHHSLTVARFSNKIRLEGRHNTKSFCHFTKPQSNIWHEIKL